MPELNQTEKQRVHFCTNNTESCIYYDRSISMIQTLILMAKLFGRETNIQILQLQDVGKIIHPRF